MDRICRHSALGVLLLSLGLALALIGCSQPAPQRRPAPVLEAPPSSLSREPISPIPLSVELPSDRVELGRLLFQDTRLSHDGSVSCASCHALDRGGTDRLPHSVGIYGQTGARNAPTVFNSGFNFRQFWDGRAVTLEDQVDGPLTAAAEMSSTWPEVLDKLNASPTYRTAFTGSYREGITVDAVKDAIATFERSLATPNARFDQFLRGDQTVLTSEEVDGYRLFRSYGCVSCHQGTNVGGNMFQRFGIMERYAPVPDASQSDDLGRFRLTGDPRDEHVFKVPSLRNVAVTAPYFHDGSAPTLEVAVADMGRYQLGRQLSGTEVERLVAFLRTLTGEYGGKPLT